MFAKSTVAVALFASFVAAQTTANSTIDPNSIPLDMRSQWCSSEISTCGTLCSGEVNSNLCDPSSLNYTCTCSSNGSTPGLQYYTGSLPDFICEQIYSNCITAGENDQAAQNVCTQNRAKNCAKLSTANFTAAATTTSSSSATATPTASSGSSAAASGSAAAASSTSTSKAAAATMMAMGREYGSGVVAVGVAAAFGLML